MNLNLDALEVKKLQLEGLKTLMTWAQQEGWNPGVYDAEVFWATDPEGFYGFYDGNELVAGGAIVSYQGLFGFMGLFIVKPAVRNLGIGRKLWNFRRNTLIKRLNSGATIGMDGVVAMQSFYQKGGFEIEFKDERYENIGISLEVDTKISIIQEEDFERIIQYDVQCFGFTRPLFLKPWLNLPESFSFQFIENHELKGYAVLRKAMSGYKIGPLFADNDHVAEALYRACLNAVPGKLVYLDIPMANQAAVNLVMKYQAKYVFECARMYYGSVPNLDINKVFGITTFELG